MCLYSNTKETEKFREKNAGKTITVWKVYNVRKWWSGVVRNVIAPCRRVYVKPGTIKSNRNRRDYDSSDHMEYDTNFRRINRGIHVFLTRKKARKYRVKSNGEQVFKATAKADDLVGINPIKQEAVFMKIHITKAEFEKGKNGRN